MENNVQETSLFAYESIKPIKRESQQMIYDLIKQHGKLTSFEIARKLNKSVNAITPRLNELMFENQQIKIIGIEEGRVKRSLYSVRIETDEKNKRNLTPIEKMNKFRSWINSKGLYISTQEAVEMLDKIIDG
jgi:predicted transcriptional regulator